MHTALLTGDGDAYILHKCHMYLTGTTCVFYQSVMVKMSFYLKLKSEEKQAWDLKLKSLHLKDSHQSSSKT